jgi:hypothetical protein
MESLNQSLSQSVFQSNSVRFNSTTETTFRQTKKHPVRPVTTWQCHCSMCKTVLALEPLLHAKGGSSCSSYLGYWLKSFGRHDNEIHTEANISSPAATRTDRQTDRDRQKANSAARTDITGEATWIAWQASCFLGLSPIRKLAHFITFAIFVQFCTRSKTLRNLKKAILLQLFVTFSKHVTKFN